MAVFLLYLWFVIRVFLSPPQVQVCPKDMKIWGSLKEISMKVVTAEEMVQVFPSLPETQRESDHVSKVVCGLLHNICQAVPLKPVSGDH